VKQTGHNYLYGFLPGYFGQNQPTAVLNRWQKAGDITNIQRYNQNLSIYTAYNNANLSDLVYSDASYIRLKNVSLSWTLPEKWEQKAHLQRCKFYVQGQNLLTFTKYKGLDPETKSSTTLPPLRVVTLGIQVTL
jgi:hypothetical protein